MKAPSFFLYNNLLKKCLNQKSKKHEETVKMENIVKTDDFIAKIAMKSA